MNEEAFQDDLAAAERPIRRGVVAVVERDGRLLVIRRSREVEAPGAYCFPGGGIEPGETEPEALRREMLEELGVASRPVRRLWRSRTSWRVELAWWLTVLESDCVLRPCPAEVESNHWLTRAEILALPELLESNHQFLAALASGAFNLDNE